MQVEVGLVSKQDWRSFLGGSIALLASATTAVGQTTTTYTYDGVGRLIQSQTPSFTTTYVEDNTSNRTQLTAGTIVVPVANPVSMTVAVSSSANLVPLNITGWPASSVTVSTAASHGTATASGASITYTPTSGYSGSDSFQYKATDSAGTSAAATVSITVH